MMRRRQFIAQVTTGLLLASCGSSHAQGNTPSAGGGTALQPSPQATQTSSSTPQSQKGSSPTPQAQSSPKATPTQEPLANKRGAGIWSFNGLSAGLANLNVGWYYDWQMTVSSSSARRKGFVPMAWNQNMVQGNLLAAAQSNASELLGFNEPDHTDQSNMSVSAALSLWPKLQATGLRLGSPAVAANADKSVGWLADFMRGIAHNRYRVDFLCVHFYPGNYTDPAAATQELVNYLEGAWSLYHKPIWLTEFALSNWQAPATPAQQLAFMRRALPALDALHFVERYAWFAMPPMGSGVLTGASLCENDGSLNALGQFYRW